MRISIVVPVLNSHEIVRRQLLHFAQIGLNDLTDVEVIVVDDGSDPPIQVPECPLHRFTLLATHDTRPWTSAVARNVGARAAVGEYLIVVDVDHILSRDLIDRCRALTEDRMGFLREYGMLDDQGVFTQDSAALVDFGLPEARSKGAGLHIGYHTNQYCIRRALFWDLGGYREDVVYDLPYPQPVDKLFKRAFDDRITAGTATQCINRPTIYMFPSGQHCAGGDVDTNPFGMFHDLTRKTKENPWAHPRRHAKTMATK
jgi:glycosyltransferase involved in cell wall biosynthesis